MFPVLYYPCDQVTGNNCIQGCMVLVGKNINTLSFFHKQAVLVTYIINDAYTKLITAMLIYNRHCEALSGLSP